MIFSGSFISWQRLPYNCFISIVLWRGIIVVLIAFGAIIETPKLRHPIYEKAASYSHFDREEFSWEQLNDRTYKHIWHDYLNAGRYTTEKLYSSQTG